MSDALLMVAASETDADLFYATRFLAGDPVIFLQTRGRKTLVLNDLEIGRGRKEARVDEVLSLRKKGGTARAIADLLRDRGVSRCGVPHNFPLGLADRLRALRIRVDGKPDPFFPERVRKAPEEVRAIEEVQRAAEAAVGTVEEVLRH